MKCPKCGKTPSLILDNPPKCPLCRVELVNGEVKTRLEKIKSILPRKETVIKPVIQQPPKQTELPKFDFKLPKPTKEGSKEDIIKIRYIGIGGALLFLIGIFMPLVHIPIVGGMTFLMFCKIGGRSSELYLFIPFVFMLYIVLIGVSFYVKKDKFTWIAITPLLMFVMYHFIRISWVVIEHSMKMSDSIEKLRGNPFAGLAKLATMDLGFGWALLLLGGFAVLYSSLKTRKV